MDNIKKRLKELEHQVRKLEKRKEPELDIIEVLTLDNMRKEINELKEELSNFD